MSKYIIDLRPDCKVVQQICVSDDNFGVGARSVELFDALTDEYVKENFKDLLEGEYQRGLEEGGEQMPCDTCAYRHNKLLCADCKWTYGSRYKVDSIGVGDVVKTYNGITYVVTKATIDGIVVGFDGEGSTCRFALSEVTKTGEHYNINEILGGLCDD